MKPCTAQGTVERIDTVGKVKKPVITVIAMSKAKKQTVLLDLQVAFGKFE